MSRLWKSGRIWAWLLALVYACPQAGAQSLDCRCVQALNPSAASGATRIAIFLSASTTPLSLVHPLGLGGGLYLQNKPEWLRYSLASSASLLAANASSTLLKLSLNRARPYSTCTDVYQLRHVGTSSFPSGHSTAAFAMATNLTLYTRKWYIAAPAFAYAGAVGWSRMHLGVHYPTDVLAGALIGTGMSLLGYHIQQRIAR